MRRPASRSWLTWPTAGTLLVLVVSASSWAQSKSPSVIESDLSVVLERLHRTLLAEEGTDPINLMWLLDQGAEYRKHGQGKALAAAWRRHFGSFERERALRCIVAAAGVEAPAMLDTVTLEGGGEVAHALEQSAVDYTDIPNLMRNLRQLAGTFGDAPGARHLVLFSLDWIDAEDHVEETLRRLQDAGVTLHVVGRSAVFNDTYWVLNPPGSSPAFLKEEVVLTGAEAPFREVPTGWLFDQKAVLTQIPSGYGPYAYARLAAETGGTYYVYSPDIHEPAFCKANDCILCAGSHTECDTPYNSSYLRLLAPDYGSRGVARNAAFSDPLFAVIYRGWEAIQKTGQLATRPPLKASGNPHGEERTLRPRDVLSPDIGHLSRSRHAARDFRTVASALREVDGLLRELEAASPEGRERSTKRAIANAELMQVQLLAALFNLEQLRLFSLAVEAEFQPGGRPALPEAQLALRGKPPCCCQNYVADNVFFCHGSDEVRRIDFFRSSVADTLLTRLCDTCDRNIERHRNTPWELATRRTAVALFRIVPPPGGM